MYREFSQPAPIIFGRGAVSVLGEKVKEKQCKKVLLIFDKGLENTGVVSKVSESLNAAGIAFVTFNGVVADPSDSIVDAAGELALREDVDCLVGLGGGSSLDTAKAAAILMSNPGPVRKYIQPTPIFVDTKIPLILIPTTAGTGSECTRVAIISLPDKNVKWSVFVNTSLALVDPELTLTLPKNQTVNTGLDAFAHAAEAMTGKNWNYHSDLYAEAAIKKISANLQICYDEPENIDARSEMLLAANWAGLAFNNPITHAGHAVADAFSCHFHTPHGLGCALALPETMALVAPVVPERMRIIANAMALPLTGAETGEQLGKMVADGIRAMMRNMNMKSLKELGIEREKVLALVPDVMANHLSSYCPVTMDEETARNLLAAVYDTYL